MEGWATIKSYIREIQLVAAHQPQFYVEALLDTGFTDGWERHRSSRLRLRRGSL